MPEEAGSPRVVVPHGELRVLQYRGGIEVAYGAKILADAGADVIVAEPPDGHPLRRRGSGRAAGGLFDHLHGGKSSVVVTGADDLENHLLGADVLVTDGLPQPWTDLHARHPHLAVVTITPFGLSGPWAGRPATDLTLQAASGGMAPRGAIGRAPVMVGGEPSYWFAGAVAAVSLLGVLPRLRATGRGELIDVSILECAHVEHGMHPVTFASMAQRPFQTSRGTPVPGIEPTSDGHVGFFVITGQQWLDFCALIGRPDWTADRELFIATQRRLRSEELLGPIRDWTRARTTSEIVETAALMRIPVAPIGTGATLPTIDHFVDQEWFVQDARGVPRPRRPYRFVGERPSLDVAPGAGSGPKRRWSARPRPATSVRATPLTLEGVRVADFTGFWAGPMASGILAGLGAEVVHIEGPRRPDGIRMNTIRSMGDSQWWEWSPLFCGANTNKLGLAVDLSAEAGTEIAHRLLATCDVMIENFSPRVVGQLGLGPEAVLARNPDLVVVRMPAFGLDGPWRDRVGFAQTIEQAVGLARVTGYEGEAPLIPNGMCDPLAGVFGAIAALVALAERDRSGVGQVVESPMIGAGLATTAEQVIEYALTGDVPVARGNGSPFMDQDVMRCVGDDQWVAISIPDEPAWAVVSAVTGATDLAGLADWCLGRTPQEVTEALWPRGVPTAPVVWAHETADNPQLQARAFFEPLDHPVCGVHPYRSWPARFGLGPSPWNRHPAPTMGQHNAAILAELGYGPDEIEALERAGVIADRVLVDQHEW